MATMLQLVQQATGEMGLTVPTAVASSTAADTVQQLALLNAVGYEIQRKPQQGWQALQKVYQFPVVTMQYTGNTVIGTSNITNASSIALLDSTFLVSGPGIGNITYVAATPLGTTIPLTLPATSTQTGGLFTFSKARFAMPADYDRIIDSTEWDKSKHWKMLGPETPQQWEWLTSGYISTGPRVRFRIFGNYFQIWPNLGTPDLLGFEYISKAWAADSLGTPKNSFTADTDTCIFPDRLMVLGLKMKYFQVKGFDFQQLYKDYRDELSIAMANDAGSAVLSMAPRQSEVLIGWANIPDTGYGA